MLTINLRDGITVIRLQHGPVNALDLDLPRALPGAVTHAPGPLFITGAGRSFCAGRRATSEHYRIA
jgi:enoyl-CoA hydratase/carnithine racemase